MKHIVLYSGGANSSLVAYLLSRQFDKKDIILLHTPTYSEHPDADRFRNEFADFVGLPITVQADGRDIWQLIKDHHCLPSDRIPFCSEELKTIQSYKFYNTMADEFVVYYGYGANEYNRVQRSTARLEHAGFKSSYPLFNLGYSDAEIKNIIRKIFRICLPEPYLYLQHNNCLPCFKGGKQHFYQVWKYYPEYFEKAVKTEMKTGHTIFEHISLIKLREKWQSQIPLFTEEDDLRPCMCAL